MICGAGWLCAVLLLQVILSTIRDDIILYSTAPGINARARVGGETHIKHFPASLRYAGDVFGTFERGYSCENIKSRGGALKCDCDSLVLFGGGGQDQKKSSTSGTNTAGAAFLLPVGLSPPRRRCRAGSAPGWRGL